MNVTRVSRNVAGYLIRALLAPASPMPGTGDNMAEDDDAAASGGGGGWSGDHENVDEIQDGVMWNKLLAKGGGNATTAVCYVLYSYSIVTL